MSAPSNTDKGHAEDDHRDEGHDVATSMAEAPGIKQEESGHDAGQVLMDADVPEFVQEQSMEVEQPPQMSFCTRDLLPEWSRKNWAPNSIIDRPLDVAEILEGSQLMAAQLAALKAINEVTQEILQQTSSRLPDAIHLAKKNDLSSHQEMQDLFKLHRAANAIRFQDQFTTSSKHSPGASSSKDPNSSS